MSEILAAVQSLDTLDVCVCVLCRCVCQWQCVSDACVRVRMCVMV